MTGLPMPAADTAAQLRALLAQGLVVSPMVHDALSARMVRDAGFETCFLSGFCVAATRYALPDTGLIAGAEMAEAVRLACAAVPGFAVIADGDTGYGNAMNARRTVAEYIAAGAAAIMIEDQEFPKRCGHFDAKRVVPLAEARMRIRAAAEQRGDSGKDIVIIARSDARAPEGYDAAMERLLRYAEEGADMLFLEAPQSEEELARFCAASPLPAMVNMVPGGRTPMLTPARLAELGAGYALYNPVLYVQVAAAQAALAGLRNGALPEATARFSEVARLAGAPAYFALQKRYEA